SLQEALRALIAGYIGARIGAGTMGTMDTDTGHTGRTDMGMRPTVATTATDWRSRAVRWVSADVRYGPEADIESIMSAREAKLRRAAILLDYCEPSSPSWRTSVPHFARSALM